MPTAKTESRSNQSRRTRKDLLQAAARLLKRGRKPSLDEVAKEALVSRATAYRYFPSVEALLREAPLDVAVPNPEEVFGGVSPDDPVARLELAEAALHKMMVDNEVPLRMLLAHSLEQGAQKADGNQPPVRQNRRMPLIEARMSAPIAPTPAPSVGVQKPSQMAPSVAATSIITSSVLNSMAPSGVSWTGCGVGETATSAPTAVRRFRSPTNSGLSLAAITT